MKPVSLWTRLKGVASKQSKNTTYVIPEVTDFVGNNFEDKLVDEGDDIIDDVYTSCGHVEMVVLNDISHLELFEDTCWDVDIERDDYQWPSLNYNVCMEQANNTLYTASVASHLEARDLVDDEICIKIQNNAS